MNTTTKLHALQVSLVFAVAAFAWTTAFGESTAAETVVDPDELGRTLVSTLNDPQQSARTRYMAVRDLAGVQYKPAITSLVSNIDFHDPTIIGSSALLDPGFLYPCAAALIDMGEVVAEQVILAATTESDPTRLKLYKHVLKQLSKKGDRTQLLLKTNLADVDDPAKRSRVEDLLNGLESEEELGTQKINE